MSEPLVLNARRRASWRHRRLPLAISLVHMCSTPGGERAGDTSFSAAVIASSGECSTPGGERAGDTSIRQAAW